MKLIESEDGNYQIVAEGADPLKVRLDHCSSCPVNYCPQMSDDGRARIAMPPRKKDDLEARVQRIIYVSENARCLKGSTRMKFSETSEKFDFERPDLTKQK